MHWMLLGSTTPYMPIVMQSPVVESVNVYAHHASQFDGRVIRMYSPVFPQFHAHEFEQSQLQYMYFVRY